MIIVKTVVQHEVHDYVDPQACRLLTVIYKHSRTPISLEYLPVNEAVSTGQQNQGPGA